MSAVGRSLGWATVAVLAAGAVWQAWVAAPFDGHQVLAVALGCAALVAGARMGHVAEAERRAARRRSDIERLHPAPPVFFEWGERDGV